MERHQPVLVRTVEREGVHFDDTTVPVSMLHHQRYFILKRLEEPRWIFLASQRSFTLTEKFRGSIMDIFGVDDVVKRISKFFLADKKFVLECMSIHPATYPYCTSDLQRDL